MSSKHTPVLATALATVFAAVIVPLSTPAAAATSADFLRSLGPAPAAPTVTAASPEAARELERHGDAVALYAEAVRKAVRAADLDLITRTEIAAKLSRIEFERRSAELAFAARSRPSGDQVAAR